MQENPAINRFYDMDYEMSIIYIGMRGTMIDANAARMIEAEQKRDAGRKHNREVR